MTDVWVVFDGTEPDSEPIGCADSIEAILVVLGNTVQMLASPVITVSYPDSLRIECEQTTELYGDKASYEGSWRAQQFSITEA